MDTVVVDDARAMRLSRVPGLTITSAVLSSRLP